MNYELKFFLFIIFFYRVDENGNKQSMLLVMTSDLLKIMAKKINSNIAPKDKYIIDVSTIKKISRGYANDSFKKSVGFFSTMFSLCKIKKPIFNLKIDNF